MISTNYEIKTTPTIGANFYIGYSFLRSFFNLYSVSSAVFLYSVDTVALNYSLSAIKWSAFVFPETVKAALE